jgi:RNA polymerase sigma-70 factor (ECF subfamily)
MGQNQSVTSISLIDRIRSQDAEAWHRLVRLYAPLVYRWCRSAGCSTEDASDISQEVFKAVFTSLDRFSKQKQTDTFRGWLRNITRNRLCEVFTQRAKIAAASGGTDHQFRMNQLEALEPTAQSEAEDTKELYHRAINLIRTDFEDTSWRAFFRTAVDGLSATEASQELGISPMAVRKAKSRVLARLRAELGEYHE